MLAAADSATDASLGVADVLSLVIAAIAITMLWFAIYRAGDDRR